MYGDDFFTTKIIDIERKFVAQAMKNLQRVFFELGSHAPRSPVAASQKRSYFALWRTQVHIVGELESHGSNVHLTAWRIQIVLVVEVLLG